MQRDVLGIPTITAESTDDLFYAQGYVHAQDRFWEMDFRRHVTSGRVSELFGESQLATDKFLRTLGWRVVAEQEVAAFDETSLAYYQAYADGVNAYLDENQGADASFEYAVLGLQNSDYEIEPWTPADSVAWLKAMAWDLRTNVEDETERALFAADIPADELAALYPAYPFDRNPVIVPTITEVPAVGTAERPERRYSDDASVATASIEWSEVDGVIEAVGALLGGAGEGIGSNSWVVSGNSPTPACRSSPTTRTWVHRSRASGTRSVFAARRCRRRARSMCRASASRACRESSSATTPASRGGSPTSPPMSPTSISRRSRATSTGTTVF